MYFFLQNILVYQKKAVLLQSHLWKIAQWCNGSTTDSGSVCLGSSPG